MCIYNAKTHCTNPDMQGITDIQDAAKQCPHIMHAAELWRQERFETICDAMWIDEPDCPFIIDCVGRRKCV